MLGDYIRAGKDIEIHQGHGRPLVVSIVRRLNRCVWLGRCMWQGATIEVCIKAIRVTNNRTAQRADIEAQIGRIQSPLICMTLTVGEYVNPNDRYTYFLIMTRRYPYNLEEYLDCHPGSLLSARDRLLIVRDILLGLAQLSEQKLVHRDVKLANVLVDPLKDFGRGRIVIADFGNARTIGGVQSRDGVIEGTLFENIAPDAFFSGNTSVDAKYDVYGVGLIFYRLFCRHHVRYDELHWLAVKQQIQQGLERDPGFRQYQPLQDFFNEMSTTHPDGHWIAKDHFRCAPCLNQTEGERLLDGLTCLYPESRMPNRYSRYTLRQALQAVDQLLAGYQANELPAYRYVIRASTVFATPAARDAGPSPETTGPETTGPETTGPETTGCRLDYLYVPPLGCQPCQINPRIAPFDIGDWFENGLPQPAASITDNTQTIKAGQQSSATLNGASQPPDAWAELFADQTTLTSAFSMDDRQYPFRLAIERESVLVDPAAPAWSFADPRQADDEPQIWALVDRSDSMQAYLPAIGKILDTLAEIEFSQLSVWLFGDYYDRPPEPAGWLTALPARHPATSYIDLIEQTPLGYGGDDAESVLLAVHEVLRQSRPTGLALRLPRRSRHLLIFTDQAARRAEEGICFSTIAAELQAADVDQVIIFLPRAQVHDRGATDRGPACRGLQNGVNAANSMDDVLALDAALEEIGEQYRRGLADYPGRLTLISWSPAEDDDCEAAIYYLIHQTLEAMYAAD